MSRRHSTLCLQVKLLFILNTSHLIYMYFTCVPCPLDFSSSVRLEIVYTSTRPHYHNHVVITVSEIHKKVSSKEVTRGSINAVTLSQPKADDAQVEKKACCKNMWKDILGVQKDFTKNSACTIEPSLRKNQYGKKAKGNPFH